MDIAGLKPFSLGKTPLPPISNPALVQIRANRANLWHGDNTCFGQNGKPGHQEGPGLFPVLEYHLLDDGLTAVGDSSIQIPGDRSTGDLSKRMILMAEILRSIKHSDSPKLIVAGPQVSDVEEKAFMRFAPLIPDGYHLVIIKLPFTEADGSSVWSSLVTGEPKGYESFNFPFGILINNSCVGKFSPLEIGNQTCLCGLDTRGLVAFVDLRQSIPYSSGRVSLVQRRLGELLAAFPKNDDPKLIVAGSALEEREVSALEAFANNIPDGIHVAVIKQAFLYGREPVWHSQITGELHGSVNSPSFNKLKDNLDTRIANLQIARFDISTGGDKKTILEKAFRESEEAENITPRLILIGYFPRGENELLRRFMRQMPTSVRAAILYDKSRPERPWFTMVLGESEPTSYPGGYTLEHVLRAMQNRIRASS